MSDVCNINDFTFKQPLAVWSPRVRHAGTSPSPNAIPLVHNPAKYSTTVEYINRTHMDVLVTDRQNIAINIRAFPAYPKTQLDEGSFIIRVTRTWTATTSRIGYGDSHVNFDATQILDACGNNTPNAEAVALGQAYRHRIDATRDLRSWYREVPIGPKAPEYRLTDDRNQAMVVEYVFDEQDIRNAVQGFYVQEVDVVLGIILDDRTKYLHPYSRIAHGVKTIPEYEGESVLGMGYSAFIEIVDEPGHIQGSRYCNFNGRIHQIHSREVLDRVPGIYVHETGMGGRQWRTTHIEFDDFELAKRMGIYTTREEARCYGDPAEQNRLSKLRGDLQMLRSKRAETRLKAEQEAHSRSENLRMAQEAADRDAQTAREAHAQAKLDREEAAKQRRESEASDKKKRFWDGFFRLATAAVGFVAAVLGLVLKFGKKAA